MGTQAAGPGSPPRGSLARRLLAAAVLSCCFLLTQAQDIPVTVNPPQPVEGQEVTLTPGGSPNIFSCNWFRGEDLPPNRIFVYLPSSEQENGPGYTGRETGGSNCSLHIRSLTLNDTGKYTVLKTTSTGLSEMGSVQIQVLESILPAESLRKPTVSAFPCPYPVEGTDSVALTCEIHSGGSIQIRWFRNGSPLGKSDRVSLSRDNRTLSILSATRDDAGRYQCEVSNSGSTEISDVKFIDVIYGPETPLIRPTEKLYKEHSDLSLVCKADAFPDARYTWFLNGIRCGSQSNLLIRSVTPEHSGNYTCQVTNVLTLQERNTTLEIEVEGAEVRDVRVTGPSVATEDQPITLTCSAVGSSISYSWFKGDQYLEPGDSLVLTNNHQNLTFNPCRRSDSGDYTCRASNSISSSFSEPHRLDILYGPDPPVVHQVFEREQLKLYLSCRANSSPAASYIWFLNGKFLPDQTKRLALDLASEYSGNYTCQAENGSTQHVRNTTLELEVQGRWRNTKTQKP